MKNKKFIAEILIGVVVYAAIVFFVHVITGKPANWTIDLAGLVAYMLAVVASRAIISL